MKCIRCVFDGPSVAHVTSCVTATLSRSLTAPPLKNGGWKVTFQGRLLLLVWGSCWLSKIVGRSQNDQKVDGAFTWRVFTPNGFGGISLWKASTYK